MQEGHGRDISRDSHSQACLVLLPFRSIRHLHMLCTTDG